MRMRSLFRAALPILFVLSLFLPTFSPAPAAAQESVKPVLTVGIAGFDQIKQKVGYLGKLANNPALAESLELILTSKTDVLDSLDRKRPAGVIVLPDPITLIGGYIFLPVSDFDAFTKSLESAGVTVEPLDGQETVFQISHPDKGMSLFLTQKGNWAYLAISPTAFALVADEPDKLVGDLGDYTMAVQLLMKNLPEPLKNMLIGQVEVGLTLGLEQESDESDEQYALRVQAAENSVKQLKRFVNELETMMIGFQLNEKNETAYFDFRAEAVSGTGLAKQWNLQKDGPSKFAGFYLPEAILTGNVQAALDDESIEQFKNNMLLGVGQFNEGIDSNEELSEEQKEKAKAFVGKTVDLWIGTIETGKVDLGLAVQSGSSPKSLSLIAGAKVADGAGFDKQFREIIEVAQQEKNGLNLEVKFDASKYGDIQFHQIIVPIPEEPAELRAALDEKLTILVGTASEAVYLAAGADAQTRLEIAIARSKEMADESVLSSRFSLAVVSLLQNAAQIVQKPEVKQSLAMSLAFLAQAGAEDRVVVTTQSIPDGTLQRIEMQKGLLRVLGTLATMGQMFGAAGN